MSRLDEATLNGFAKKRFCSANEWHFAVSIAGFFTTVVGCVILFAVRRIARDAIRVQARFAETVSVELIGGFSLVAPRTVLVLRHKHEKRVRSEC